MAFLSTQRANDAQNVAVEHLSFPGTFDFLGTAPIRPLGTRETGPYTPFPFVSATRYTHQWLWKTVERISFSGSISETLEIFYDEDDGGGLFLQEDVDYSFSDLQVDLNFSGTNIKADRHLRTATSDFSAVITLEDSLPVRIRDYEKDGTLVDDVTENFDLEIDLRLRAPVFWSSLGFTFPVECRVDKFRIDEGDLDGGKGNVGDFSFQQLGITPFRYTRQTSGPDFTKSNLSCNLTATVVSEF